MWYEQQRGGDNHRGVGGIMRGRLVAKMDRDFQFNAAKKQCNTEKVHSKGFFSPAIDEMRVDQHHIPNGCRGWLFCVHMCR